MVFEASPPAAAAAERGGGAASWRPQRRSGTGAAPKWRPSHLHVCPNSSGGCTAVWAARQGQSWGGEGTGEIIETQPWWPWSCAGFEGISLLPKPGGGGAVLGAPCAFHRAPCVGLLVALWLWHSTAQCICVLLVPFCQQTDGAQPCDGMQSYGVLLKPASWHFLPQGWKHWGRCSNSVHFSNFLCW